jgi:hypothetical protein
MIYSVSPPQFNTETGQLSYRIASTHFDAQGKINTGSFNLVISQNFAKCLWAINPENLTKASVQIVYEDGTPVIGTSTLGVKNGWVYLNVENFTFSSPTISVKLENVIVPETPTLIKPEIQSVKKPNSAKLSKITITCTKGKVSKKVTAVSPKCPSGYKKK